MQENLNLNSRRRKRNSTQGLGIIRSIWISDQVRQTFMLSWSWQASGLLLLEKKKWVNAQARSLTHSFSTQRWSCVPALLTGFPMFCILIGLSAYCSLPDYCHLHCLTCLKPERLSIGQLTHSFLFNWVFLLVVPPVSILSTFLETHLTTSCPSEWPA